MSIAQVRVLLGDLPKWDRQTATGDGNTKRYIVSALPIITGSEIVTVAGSTQTLTTHYSLNADLGLFVFVTAPADTAAIVAQFSYAELSDESITAILALNSNVYVAAALGAESLAGKYASLVDKKIGDLSNSYSQRAKAWLELAKRLRSSVQSTALLGALALASPYAGGISVADKRTVASNTDRTRPAFTTDLHDTPLGSYTDADL